LLIATTLVIAALVASAAWASEPFLNFNGGIDAHGFTMKEKAKNVDYSGFGLWHLKRMDMPRNGFIAVVGHTKFEVNGEVSLIPPRKRATYRCQARIFDEQQTEFWDTPVSTKKENKDGFARFELKWPTLYSSWDDFISNRVIDGNETLPFFWSCETKKGIFYANEIGGAMVKGVQADPLVWVGIESVIPYAQAELMAILGIQATQMREALDRGQPEK